MQQVSTTTSTLAALLIVGACTSPVTDPAEESLGPIEQILDPVARGPWPGLDSKGQRLVQQINGYSDGEETAYWFFAFASRLTADVFVFCREGDTKPCPFDAKGRAQWGNMVGDPVFARMPGEAGYSPFWLVWLVRVPADYQANEIKSVAGLHRAADAGRVHFSEFVFDHGGSIGKDLTVMHCALALAGTTLERNGEDIVGKPGVKMRVIEDRQGWHKQYRTHFFDFTANEGVFSIDPTSPSRPMMRTSDIFVLFRDCKGAVKPSICDLIEAAPAAVSVSESGVGTDLTKDGDSSDSNNILIATPGKPPASPADQDRSYSPLWRVNKVLVVADHDQEVLLMDSTKDQQKSSIRSIGEIRSAVAKGWLREPEFLSEAASGSKVPGNDGKTFFSCPSQVPNDGP